MLQQPITCSSLQVVLVLEEHEAPLGPEACPPGGRRGEGLAGAAGARAAPPASQRSVTIVSLSCSRGLLVKH